MTAPDIDSLRRAAKVLREHAEPLLVYGRWEPDPHGPAGESYTALVDPTVGLALADWLSNCADRLPYSDRHTPEQAHALVIARAVLREAEDA